MSRRSLIEKKIVVVGYPGEVGGANTECWYAVKLWREFGAEVALIPTWRASTEWRERLDAIGCKTIEAAPETLHQHVGPNDIAVAFCNAYFLLTASDLRETGCKTVWVNCMERMSATEEEHYRNGRPFDGYVFQSEHQKGQLIRQLERVGVREEQTALIRGAFDVKEWAFRQPCNVKRHKFVVGRISRADPRKFSRRTWQVYGAIRDRLLKTGIDCRVRILGWSEQVGKKIGSPPEWAECMPVGAEPAQTFMRSIDCMIQLNGGVGENWPRSGLEAMASGVPVIVPNRWGWREMIRHVDGGFLVDNDDQAIDYAVKLATRPVFYRLVAEQARREVTWKSNPRSHWSKWLNLFDSLGQ